MPLDRLVDLVSPDHTAEPALTNSAGGLANVSGVVATTPADVTKKIDVVVSHFDGGQVRVGPCRWRPAGAALPQRGDECLVSFDELGDAWVTCWWPS